MRTCGCTTTSLSIAGCCFCTLTAPFQQHAMFVFGGVRVGRRTVLLHSLHVIVTASLLLSQVQRPFQSCTHVPHQLMRYISSHGCCLGVRCECVLLSSAIVSEAQLLRCILVAGWKQCQLSVRAHFVVVLQHRRHCGHFCHVWRRLGTKEGCSSRTKSNLW